MLSHEKRVQAVKLLVEGNSLRSTSRISGVSLGALDRLLGEMGTVCQNYQNEALRNLSCARLQIDEIWSFCHTKSRNLKKPIAGRGDIWTYTSIDPDTKLVPHWLVGHRTMEYVHAFIEELTFRLTGRVQLTSDGFNAYVDAVSKYPHRWDYAQYVKVYENGGHDRANVKDRYIGHQLKVITGEPWEKDINTSIAERNHLTMRMSIKRFARKTNAHSKKVENHAHAVALHMMHYNFARIHGSIRVTPAMAAGISERVWTVEDIVDLLYLKEMKALVKCG